MNSENEVQLVVDGHIIHSKNLGVLCLAGYHGEFPYNCLVIWSLAWRHCACHYLAQWKDELLSSRS